jgi:hypothetical protein
MKFSQIAEEAKPELVTPQPLVTEDQVKYQFTKAKLFELASKLTNLKANILEEAKDLSEEKKRILEGCTSSLDSAIHSLIALTNEASKEAHKEVEPAKVEEGGIKKEEEKPAPPKVEPKAAFSRLR